MNVGLLITKFPPDVNNGAELQIKQLAAELARRGHQVTVYTRRLNRRKFVEHQDGYQIRRQRVFPLAALRMIVDAVVTVFDMRRQVPRPDVLLCYQSLSAGLIGVVAKRLLGIPSIVSIRGNREFRLRLTWANRLVVPFVYRGSTAIVVQTPSILRDLREQLVQAGRGTLWELIRQKVVIIPNGIHLPELERASGSKVMYVGRLNRNKRVSDLLDALEAVPQADALIVGEGPERPQLEARADASHVSFTGQVDADKVRDFLQQARMLVHPSHLGDGLPNSILEAMSCGVPVVASRTSGMPDVVRDGVTGYLFEPGDIPQLTDCIERLRNDDELWAEMGSNALEEVKQYTWENVVPQVEELLRSACLREAETISPAGPRRLVMRQGTTE